MHNSVFEEHINLTYGRGFNAHLYGSVRDSLHYVQRLKLQTKLNIHNGCVNTICWNDSGTHLLSGSDDQHLNITNPFNEQIVSCIHTSHRSNIFCARFLPHSNDQKIISCSGDGMIYYIMVDRPELHSQYSFNCHSGTVYELAAVPYDPNTFLSCGEDGTVRWFDLRTKAKCNQRNCKQDVLINCRRALTALAINPLHPYELSVACSDSTTRVFDRRMLGTRATGNYVGRGLTAMVSRFVAPHLESRSHRITSLKYSPDGREVLVNYSADQIYLFDLKEDGRSFKQLGAENTEESLPSGASGGATSKPTPMKRLRLRGDWSDTGPNARPQHERSTDPDPSNLLQRVSDMLTRWLDGNQRRTEGRADSAQPSDVSEEITDQARAEASEPVTSPIASTSATQSASTNATHTTNNQNLPTCSKSSDNIIETEQMDATVKKTVINNSAKDPPSPSASGNEIIHAASAGDTEMMVTENVVMESSQQPVNPHSEEGESERENTSMRSDVEMASSRDWRIAEEVVRTEELVTVETTLQIRDSEDEDLGSFVTEQDTVATIVEGINAHMRDKSPALQTSSQTPDRDLRRGLKDGAVVSLDYHSEGTSSSTVHIHYPTEDTQSMERSPPLPPPPPLPDNTPRVTRSCPLPPIEGSIETELHHTCRSEPSTSTSGLIIANQTEDKVDEDENVISDSEHSGAPQSDAGEAIAEPPSENTREDLEQGPTRKYPRGAQASRIPVASKPGVSGISMGGQTRQRRIGHSGPPTGDFNPYSSDSSDSSDNEVLESVAEAMRDLRTKHVRDVVTRNNAARRLQEAYRVRRANREQHEQENTIFTPAVKHVYSGHRNTRTMIKECAFYGNKYIVSGSDCGHMFIWDRDSGRLVNLLEADEHVVNTIQPHPHEPIIATSGIDYDVKIWSCSAEEPDFDAEKANEVMKRNKFMLEETRDTITVPASFMLRMFASLNHIRTGQRPDADRSSGSSGDDSHHSDTDL